MRLALVATVCALVLALSACGNDIVARYCSYGAVSDAQYQGCVDHVTVDDVRSRDTPAARYALGED